jgi:hypothetical protein
LGRHPGSSDEARHIGRETALEKAEAAARAAKSSIPRYRYFQDFLHLSGSIMIDDKLAHLRAHVSNISRYRRLLKTNLSELERQFLERRLREEMFATEGLAHPIPLMPNDKSRREGLRDDP